MSYKDEIIKSMTLLSEHPKTIFLGQSINYWGCIYNTLDYVPIEKKLELPIAEEMQLGMSTGLSLAGFIPVSVYMRHDFLILAMNQLVNHLDKLEEMSCGQFKPKVIIRAIVGNKKPLNSGPQHYQDHTQVFRESLTNIDVVKLLYTRDIVPAYKKALESTKSTLLIELRDLYDTEEGNV
jgi:pyruvate/2-oxoglutarate/acetoin dehydrogenase E1 component